MPSGPASLPGVPQPPRPNSGCNPGCSGTALAQGPFRQPAAASALTTRELEVAGLVAAGKSNREVAAGLFLSERTAQNHVQHILTKLGFSNRSQITSWVLARQPDEYRIE
jgi:DNA-binding NarL/FixJ family response regulator